jgi:hypothetical protein
VIPVCNDVAHVTDKNRDVCEIKQAGLLRSYRHFLLKFVAGLPKLSLGAMADRAEPGEKEGTDGCP